MIRIDEKDTVVLDTDIYKKNYLKITLSPKEVCLESLFCRNYLEE